MILEIKAVAPLPDGSDPGSHKLLQVEWVDIIKDPGWVEHTEVECPKLVSVGWVVFEDDAVLKLADTLDEDGTGFGIMALPKGVIISRKLL